MSDFSKRIKTAQPEDFEDETFVCEIVEVFESIRRALSTSESLRKRVPYTIAPKPTKPTQKKSGLILSKLGQQRTEENVPITAFLRGVQEGKTCFWTPIHDELIIASEPHTEDQRRFLSNPINRSVLYCLVLRDAKIHNTILHRFSCIVLHKLTSSGCNSQSIATDFQKFGLRTHTNVKTLEKEIDGFINAGSRYLNIGKNLGGLGAVPFLPHDLGSWAWEVTLPKSGLDYNTAIENLKSAGIEEASAPYHQLAQKLVDTGIQMIKQYPASGTEIWGSGALKRGLEYAGQPRVKRRYLSNQQGTENSSSAPVLPVALPEMNDLTQRPSPDSVPLQTSLNNQNPVVTRQGLNTDISHSSVNQGGAVIRQGGPNTVSGSQVGLLGPAGHPLPYDRQASDQVPPDLRHSQSFDTIGYPRCSSSVDYLGSHGFLPCGPPVEYFNSHDFPHNNFDFIGTQTVYNPSGFLQG